MHFFNDALFAFRLISILLLVRISSTRFPMADLSLTFLPGGSSRIGVASLKEATACFLSFICDNNEFRWFYCSCRRDWCPFQSRTIHVNQRQVVYMYLNTCYCLAFPPSRTSAWACSGQSWKRNPISMRWSSLFRDPVNAHCPGKKMPWLTAFWNQNRTRKFQDADCALFFSAAVLYISWYLVYIILSERCLQRC